MAKLVFDSSRQKRGRDFFSLSFLFQKKRGFIKMMRLLSIDYTQYRIIDESMLDGFFSEIRYYVELGVDKGFPVLMTIFGLGALIYVISMFVPRK